MVPAGFPVTYDLPVANRPATVQGVSIAIQILAWIAVILRLWARIKLIRRPGWDDLFVVLACLSVTWGTVCVVLETFWGLGLHLFTIFEYTKSPPDQDFYAFAIYCKLLFLANVSYACSTTLIKLSILFQFRRLFDRRNHPVVNISCLVLICITIVWGLFFALVTIFGCHPIHKEWDVLVDGNCILFGSKVAAKFYPAYAAHTASNMCLDILILAIPIPSLATLKLRKRQKSGLIGVFSIGLIVVICSVIRLWLIVKTRAGSYPTQDETWYAAPIVIMSCLEVNLAILCASMPIFWPYLPRLSFHGIKVVREVIIRNETRRDRPYNTSTNDGSEPTDLSGLERTNSDTSVARLKRQDTAENLRHYYKDSHVKGLVVGDLEMQQAQTMEERDPAGKPGHTAEAWAEPLELKLKRTRT
ncbi:hypothetical protein K490DRAFT_66288 [Saccharata proteae CBS 121410]|uniref:Rhodopsin domain-containing protein n=1 Tax=Saccharata proteae CBS 121410 TaxID=1314787 RepID=A0A9P4HWN6_9PEZI|nr:hypothetical protein K490DRAFT_66288 [Saccharata proteae CBS 121410]